MTSFARGGEPEQRRPARPRPETVTGTVPDGPDHARSLLRLQRLAGNRAAERVAARHRSPGHAPVVQRRRVPVASEVDPLVASGATDQSAHIAGLERANQLAFVQLPTMEKAAVLHTVHTRAGGLPAYNAMPRAAAQRLLADVLRTTHPELVLGAPNLINTGPRPATADAANINTLVTNAAALVGIVTSGARDNDLRDVFGAANVAAVKARYTAAMAQMNLLHGANRIVTDRSGYNAEVGLGGLTNPQQIALSPVTIDNPGNDESVVTMIHESMHAGVPTVRDYGYIGSASFKTLDEATKLDNAAHYEVVPRRIKGLAGSYAGEVFVPAGTSVSSGGAVHTAPPLTDLEQAARNASESVRSAWAVGLNLHNLWVRVNVNRADWTGVNLPTTYTGAAAARFADCMPYWSAVQMMTVHQRPHLAAGGASAADAPVTQIDIALSEGMVRQLRLAMDVATTNFQSAATINSLLAARTSAHERSAATTVPAKTDLLLTAVRRAFGQITGNEGRDVQVIKAMAAASGADYSHMLAPRAPSFP